MNSVIDIRKTVRSRLPSIPFEGMAKKLLGERYILSLVICSDTLARRINRAYRKKKYSPNVLSFPLAEYEGEIFLNVRSAAREAKAAGISANERIAQLFVHGCLHLRGFRHGSKMETLEKITLRKFDF